MTTPEREPDYVVNLTSQQIHAALSAYIQEQQLVKAGAFRQRSELSVRADGTFAARVTLWRDEPCDSVAEELTDHITAELVSKRRRR